MDEKTRKEYIQRMQNAMRPMTAAEIAKMQAQQAPLMRNNIDAMRGGAEMQNFWTTDENESHWIQEKPKPTFWQRLKKLFARPNL